MPQQTEIGRSEGMTSYSGYAEAVYEKVRDGRHSLSASEYVAVVEGFLREFVCMGQCNLYIASAKDSQIKEAIKVYFEDVCNPNIHEMKKILEDDGYKLPAPLEEAASPSDVGATIVIDRSAAQPAHCCDVAELSSELSPYLTMVEGLRLAAQTM